MKTGRASPQRATYVGRTTSLKQDLSSYFGRLATSRCRHRCSTTASRAARLSCRTGAWADPNSTSRWQATMGTEYKAVERYTRGTIMPARQPYRVPLRTTFRATASRRCRSACSIQSNGPPADSQARTQSRGCRGGQLWRRGGQATVNTALSASNRTDHTQTHRHAHSPGGVAVASCGAAAARQQPTPPSVRLDSARLCGLWLPSILACGLQPQPP